MKTLKAEQVNGMAFTDIGDARRQIDRFIAEVYNKERLHSAPGYQSPLEFETFRAKISYGNASWQTHCHRNYRVSPKGCSPVHLTHA